MTHRMLTVCLFLALTSSTLAQEKAKKKDAPARPDPTAADFAYGSDSERQKFDFWQAKSDKPTPLVLLIHGGGWMGGDKSGYGASAIQPFLDAGISVASINYRFIPQAMEQKVEPPVKACLHDAARALANASLEGEGVEPRSQASRVPPAVRPARALRCGWRCTTIWPIRNSSDPIARESTRLTCAAVSGAQTSLDPEGAARVDPQRDLRRPRLWISEQGANGRDEFDLLIANREKVLPWIKEYSPIELVSGRRPADLSRLSASEIRRRRSGRLKPIRRIRPCTACNWPSG